MPDVVFKAGILMLCRRISDDSVVAAFCVGVDRTPEWFKQFIFASRVIGGPKVGLAIVKVSTGVGILCKGMYAVVGPDGALDLYSEAEFAESFSFG